MYWFPRDSPAEFPPSLPPAGFLFHNTLGKGVGGNAADEDVFSRAGLAAEDLDVARGEAQGLCEQGHDGLVGGTAFGRLGDGDLQTVAVGADDAIARRAGDDLDVQEHASIALNKLKRHDFR